MDITSPLFLALLANGPVKADGYTYFLYGEKPGNANPAGDPESPEQRERNKPRTDSRKSAKCGKFTNGLSGTYQYGESRPEREGFPRATLYSIQPMEDAYSRAKEYGHSKLSVFPWEP
jgi:hypothetical protein